MAFLWKGRTIQQLLVDIASETKFEEEEELAADLAQVFCKSVGRGYCDCATFAPPFSTRFNGPKPALHCHNLGCVSKKMQMATNRKIVGTDETCRYALPACESLLATFFQSVVVQLGRDGAFGATFLDTHRFAEEEIPREDWNKPFALLQHQKICSRT